MGRAANNYLKSEPTKCSLVLSNRELWSHFIEARKIKERYPRETVDDLVTAMCPYYDGKLIPVGIIF